VRLAVRIIDFGDDRNLQIGACCTSVIDWFRCRFRVKWHALPAGDHALLAVLVFQLEMSLRDTLGLSAARRTRSKGDFIGRCCSAQICMQVQSYCTVCVHNWNGGARELDVRTEARRIVIFSLGP
jgi:hypothetical protein